MKTLIEVNNLSVNYKKHEAIKNVSFKIKEGETFALVGESGCGKTTIANAILGFIPFAGGEIKVNGILINNKRTLKEARQYMQVIFQDPYSSFNPRLNVEEILSEPLVLKGIKDPKTIKEKIEELIVKVGLNIEDLKRPIFEFSGGQRQRIAIARAIVTKPKFIICDEPTSSLDVSFHAQIMQLLYDIQKELKISYLFISHNLAVVKSTSENMAVMYLGQIVEYGNTAKIFSNPIHPYTKLLLSAIIDLNSTSSSLKVEDKIKEEFDEFVLKNSLYNEKNPKYKKISEDHFSMDIDSKGEI